MGGWGDFFTEIFGNARLILFFSFVIFLVAVVIFRKRIDLFMSQPLNVDRYGWMFTPFTIVFACFPIFLARGFSREHLQPGIFSGMTAGESLSLLAVYLYLFIVGWFCYREGYKKGSRND